MATHINRKIITWARERNRLTIEALAAQMKKSPEEIKKWEDGLDVPSYASLEALAYRHLKIPLAIFFFPEPPAIDDPVSKFRRLPNYEFARLSSDTLQTIRLTQGYQDSLVELVDRDIPRRKIFNDVDRKGRTPHELAKRTREYLGITLKNQFGFRSPEEAFKAWRHSLENAGIFSFKDSLKDKFISGFCLLHNEFPVIFVNNSNAFSRQIFTLIHELGHILFELYGVTDVDEKYLEFMSSKEKLLEVKCNQYASEVLVPEDSFQNEIPIFRAKGPDVIPRLAAKYSVSKEVILRRFLDHGLVTEDYYKAKAEEWNQEYLRNKSEALGGNYYLTKLSYLGLGFAQVGFGNYHSGRLTKMQLANHLNVNSRNLDKLERYVG